jgi:predicted dehydrogenase
MTFAPSGKSHAPRVAIVGLGRVYDLNVLAYRDNVNVEVVALVDPNGDRRHERGTEWPGVPTFATVTELLASDVRVDAAEVLVPIARHVEVVEQLTAAGIHVNLQKPLSVDLEGATRILNAAAANDVTVRVMENYLFYEPLRRLKSLVDEGALGATAGYHMKMVASGRGGWDVPGDTYARQFELARQGRGPLLFDDGWHKLSTALWLFGPVREVRAWIGSTEVLEGVAIDAPTTVQLEHHNGVRGVWDVTLAVDLYLRSDYYTNDERWEVTGRSGFARVNRCTARGLQQPSLEVYADGELRSFHVLDDDWASSFAASGRHWLEWLRTRRGPLCWSSDEAVEVLRLALAAYESHALGGLGVDPASLAPVVQ